MKYVRFFFFPPQFHFMLFFPSYFTLGTNDVRFDQAQLNMPVKFKRKILPATGGLESHPPLNQIIIYIFCFWKQSSSISP